MKPRLEKRLVSFLVLPPTWLHPGTGMDYNPDMGRRLPYVWDYDIDEGQFRDLLTGKLTLGHLDRQWAAVRLIEFGTYEEMVRELGFRGVVEGWAEWRKHVKSEGRKRGLDFLVEWIPRQHPELL